jgi:hypothetical protein
MLKHKEQTHEDVELVLLESLLRLEARGARARLITKLGIKALKEITESQRSFIFAGPACLLILRFGDKRSKSNLSRCFRERTRTRPPHLIRASAISYATYGRNEFTEVKRAAALLLNNPLALMVRMVKKLQTLRQVPDRFKARLTIRWDSVRGRHYIDMRTCVALGLLALNRREAIRQWLRQWVKESKKKSLSAFDGRLIRRFIK